MSKRVIGLLCVWGCDKWIKYTCEQALEYCDEVIACCAPHSEKMLKYEDRTEEIVRSYKNIKYLEYNYYYVHSAIKADILNKMLNISSIEDEDWIFILDSDEFYHKQTIDFVKANIGTNKFNSLTFKAYYFFINMKYYLIGEHTRLYKFYSYNKEKGKMFYPTQNFYIEHPINGITDLSRAVYHFGLLLNPYQKMDMWSEEYDNTKQDNKVKWMDQIYRNYDLNNQKYWIDKNEKLSGIKSCWYNDGFKADKNGEPFKFEGEIPDIIKNSDLYNIEDHRLTYNFK